MPLYILDTNFFIEAHNKTYPLDVAQGFWKKVQALASNGIIISIDKVEKELNNGHDQDLISWCKVNLPLGFFVDSSPCIPQYSKLASWAAGMSHQYIPNAISEFLHADEADAFLIAYGLMDVANHTIVTQEVSAPLSKKKIKIPDVCLANQVNYLDTIKMFRNLKETF